LAHCHVRFIDEQIEARAIALRRKGTFKLPDAIVAATAITGSLRLLTLDQGMLRGLQKLGS
jgi:predicted nucleic acid-binding protein